MGTGQNIPLDKELYARVKKAVYKKYPQHSAYRSGRLVQEYLKRGGRYQGKRKSGKLARWFREKWTNQHGGIGYKRKGDVYRPSKRISKQTPTTWQELSPKQVKRAQREKLRTGRVKRFKPPSCTKIPLHHSKSHRVPGAPTSCRRGDGKIMDLPRKYSRKQCQSLARKGFTQRASCAAYLKGGDGSLHPQDKNVDGGKLEPCNVSKDATGYERSNYCTQAEGDDGMHYVCFADIAKPLDTGKGPQTFCQLSNQSNWCTEGNKGHWCVCQNMLTDAWKALLRQVEDQDEATQKRVRQAFRDRIRRQATHEFAQPTLEALA